MTSGRSGRASAVLAHRAPTRTSPPRQPNAPQAPHPRLRTAIRKRLTIFPEKVEGITTIHACEVAIEYCFGAVDSVHLPRGVRGKLLRLATFRDLLDFTAQSRT